MRSRAAVSVVLLLVLGALLPAAAGAGGGPSASDLEGELVCPVCKTTLDQSDAPIARRMKALIRQRLAEGASAAQIKAELVDQFGPGVLAEPPKHGFDLLAWALPLAALGLGACFVGVVAWAWSRQRGGAPDEPEPIDDDLSRRVDDELARFDT